jgi:hypothetical protein
MTKYYIHDNGAKPFRVDIYKKIVTINILCSEYHDDPNDNCYKKFITYTPKEIFIGKSKKNEMTEFSGGYGPEFDGNSILLWINNLKYIFIGKSIYSFNAFNKIIYYESPVGNSDVPYPYAIDEKGYVYLFVEGVILAPNNKLIKYLDNKEIDPYDYYCETSSMNNFENIKTFYIGKNIYTLTYKPNATEDYKRLLTFYDDEVNKYGISVVYYNGTKKQLTEKMYVNLMKRFAKLNGLYTISGTMIHDRLD